MNRYLILGLTAGALAIAGCATEAEAEAMDTTPAPAAEVTAESFHEFTMNSIEGEPVELKKYEGQVKLVVNVASRCGLTPQYEALQSLYDAHKEDGLVVMGFPANEFGGQEPGSDAEILEFCTGEYGVSFPMFSKIVVKGDEIHPLYAWLIANSDRPTDEIEWNFAKFVVGKDGQVKARFGPRTAPDDPELVAAIQAELEA